MVFYSQDYVIKRVSLTSAAPIFKYTLTDPFKKHTKHTAGIQALVIKLETFQGERSLHFIRSRQNHCIRVPLPFKIFPSPRGFLFLTLKTAPDEKKNCGSILPRDIIV